MTVTTWHRLLCWFWGHDLVALRCRVPERPQMRDLIRKFRAYHRFNEEEHVIEVFYFKCRRCGREFWDSLDRTPEGERRAG